MTKNILKATHIGELHIGDKDLSCAVLEDGTRVLNMTAVFKAFNRPVRSRINVGDRVINMPSFLDAKNLQPFVSNELRGVINPITYLYNNKKTKGYDSTILPLLCDVYLDARRAGVGVLTKKQYPLAEASEILVRTLSKVGIIALVDEATGYQEVRARKALEEILDKFIAEELRKWAKTFPDAFYKEMFRLRGWSYNPFSVKRPSYVGNLTNDIVYERLAPGVLEELKRVTPKDSKGRRKHRYFQRLTEDIGNPRLREHLAAVIALMKASTKWSQFERSIQRAFPKWNEQMLLDLPEN